MTETVERVAKGIAREVPLDAGSRWNAGYGYDYPGEYSRKERQLITGIARDAIRTYEPTDTEIEKAIEATGNRWGFGIADARIFLQSLRDQVLA